MTTEVDYIDFTVSSHFLSALINDDYSGLEDKEENQLTQWLESLDLPKGHWGYAEDSENFKTCEITKQFSETIELRWIIME